LLKLQTARDEGFAVTDPIEFQTTRLLLRQWTPADRAPFATMNADPRVMRHFPALLSRAESDAMADRCQALIEERGWGFWAVELKASGAFIGFVGLHTPSATLPFSPCVEIGWRLAADYWGQGSARSIFPKSCPSPLSRTGAHVR